MGTLFVFILAEAINLGQDWEQGTTGENVNPFKIDAYPQGSQMEVWVLGGPGGKTPYQALYSLQKPRDLRFTQRGNTKLLDLSIGESGTWAIDSYRKLQKYDSDTNTWLSVQTEEKWRQVESSSPEKTVYLIEFDQGYLYYLTWDKINYQLTNTEFRVQDISSSSYRTYVIIEGDVGQDDNLKYFDSPPENQNIKGWVDNWMTANGIKTFKLSVGFDWSIAYLNPDQTMSIGQPLTLEDEKSLPWTWMKDPIKLSDFTAGPVYFGIYGDNIYIKRGLF